MWESRVLCEISKRLRKSFCDFHRRVISTARRSYDSSVASSPVDLGRRPSRPAFFFSRNR